MIKRFLSTLFVALISGAAVQAAPASAAGPASLIVEGKIEIPLEGKRLTLSSEDVAKLPVTRFRTHTPWTGESEFAGVRIADVLDHVKANPNATEVVTKTIDGYSVSLPMDLVRKYPVILAYEINGKRLTAANKGPYWVMFPTDDFPELKSNKTNERSAWAVKGLVVK